jgi:hypothetical protein
MRCFAEPQPAKEAKVLKRLKLSLDLDQPPDDVVGEGLLLTPIRYRQASSPDLFVRTGSPSPDGKLNPARPTSTVCGQHPVNAIANVESIVEVSP